MKKSMYVVHAKGENGDHLVMNMATGAFAQLSDGAWSLLKQGGETEAAPDAPDADAAADVVAQLEEAGFLVPDGLDELAQQQALFEASRKDPSTLSLALAPTYACNCRCAYCYEQDKATAKSLMTPEVRQALYDFVADRFAQQPFRRLFVEWYGGDPSLCLDLVEEVSQRLMGWCADQGVAYDAMMLSNCVRIGEQEAALIAHCKVGSMLVTIDGPEEIHNLRRPAPGEDNPFAKIKAAIGYLMAEGVEIQAQINLDKVTAPLLPDLQQEFAQLGVAIMPVKLNDYAHSFGTGCFAPPHFDLFTHQEFAHAQCDLMVQMGRDARSIGALLAPSCRFCLGQTENYFVVDAFGDVYKCDGWMGDKRRRLFSLLDDEPVVDAISYDPFQEPRCRVCPLLPVCWGNCSWEQERTDWPCHPLKYTLTEHLRDYRACFGPAEGPVALFVAGAPAVPTPLADGGF